VRNLASIFNPAVQLEARFFRHVATHRKSKTYPL